MTTCGVVYACVVVRAVEGWELSHAKLLTLTSFIFPSQLLHLLRSSHKLYFGCWYSFYPSLLLDPSFFHREGKAL